ncbi:MAG: VPLPA-CTERM sorting domain-containing protein, partial [Pseudomonadota bacterium]
LFDLDTDFQAFSPQRIFRPVGGDTFDVLFFNPAKPDERATSTGLGVVFTDVEQEFSTFMEFFDADGDLLASEFVETAGDTELSFLGLIYDAPIVSRVSITAGLFGDNVAMDDFIFGEPTPSQNVPLPAAGWMLMAGLGGLVAARRARRPVA